MTQTPSTPTERGGLALSDNIEIITRFEHAFRAADQATIDELCDPGLVNHNPAPDEEPSQRTGRAAGVACAASGTTDVLDAIVIVTAVRHQAPVVTSDPGDLTRIADSIGVKIRVFPT